MELPLIYAGVHPAKRKELAEQYLEKVELHSRMHHLPSELSGGQKTAGSDRSSSRQSASHRLSR